MAKCEKSGCDSTVVDVYKYSDVDENKDTFVVLCPDCACNSGFCVMCGWFVAGTGNENWNGTGLCFDCCQELDNEIFFEE